MRKSKSSGSTFKVLQTIGIIATIISAVIAIATLISPDSVSNLTKQSIGFNSQYRTPDGDVRPAVVPAQTTVFIISAVVFIIVLGGTWSIYYYAGTDKEARLAAIGKGRNKIYYFLLTLPFLIIFLLLGNAMPRGIFNPTHARTLALYFPLGAWAKNSILGGCVLGFIGLGISGLFVLATKFLLLFSKESKEKKMRQKLRLS